ncbi:MAG: type II toxin-antitoxin system VapC family toxin [Magnetococcales bacterium]|nr:type II toxin-antitoxin system VapC family toxin [Magnetococcales bacterium]
MSGIDWLLDTSLVIGLLKGQDAAMVLAEEKNLVLQRTAVSQITRMELLGFPELTEAEEAEIRSFLDACQVVLLDEMVEHQAIRLRRSGMFKLPDAIIAATALTLRVPLLTLDRGMSAAMGRMDEKA